MKPLVDNILWLSIATVLALAIACDEGDDDGCSSDAGVDGDTDADTDADGDTDDNGCVETFEDFEGDVEGAGGFYDSDVVVIEAYEAIESQDYGYAAALGLYLRDAAAGDYELEPTLDVDDCDKCIVLGTNCSIHNPSSCITFFVATEGFLDLVMIVEGEPWDNYFAFVAEDVVLSEHLIDWETGVAEPVSDGETICVDLWHMGLTLSDWN